MMGTLPRGEDSHLDVEQAVIKFVGDDLEPSSRDEWYSDDVTKRPRYEPSSLVDHEALIDEALLDSENTLMQPISPDLDSSSDSSHLVKLSRHQRHAVHEFDQDDLKRRFGHIIDVEHLVIEASMQACDWYNQTDDGKLNPASLNGPKVRIGPRKFSEEEISAVDHFIAGYCYIKKLTRTDVCRRIWQNQRKKDQFWEQLTRVLPYRSRASTYKHIKRQYHTFDVRARWTKADDGHLRSLVEANGFSWCLIGNQMDRMPEDCRDRWRNYVKCGENRSSHKWSVEEERQLVQIVTNLLRQAKTDPSMQRDKVNWTLVSDQMQGKRSRIQCRYKWNKLTNSPGSIRADVMDYETKSWIVDMVISQSPHDIASVDWGVVTTAYSEWPGLVGSVWGWREMRIVVSNMVEDMAKKMPGSSFLQLLECIRNELQEKSDISLLEMIVESPPPEGEQIYTIFRNDLAVN